MSFVYFHIKVSLVLGDLVEFRETKHSVRFGRSVKKAKCQRWQSREEHIVKADKPAFEEDLTGEAVEKSEPQLDHIQADVLVVAVENDFAKTLVIPDAVNEKELRKKAELADGVVRG